MLTNACRCCILVCCFILAEPLQAQPHGWPLTEQSQIALHWIKPSLEHGADLSVYSGNLYLSGRFLAGPGAYFVTEIPVAIYAWESESYWTGETQSEYGSAWGNPYFGIEAGPESRLFIVEGGLRLPIADYQRIGDNHRTDALLLGVLGDYSHHAAFADYALPVRLTVSGNPRFSDGKTRLRFWFGLWHYVPFEKRDESETFAHYGIWLHHSTNSLHIGGGLLGDYHLAEGSDFEDDVVHQLAFQFGMSFGKTTPTLGVRLPLTDNLSSVLNYSFELGAAYSLE